MNKKVFQTLLEEYLQHQDPSSLWEVFHSLREKAFSVKERDEFDQEIEHTQNALHSTIKDETPPITEGPIEETLIHSKSDTKRVYGEQYDAESAIPILESSPKKESENILEPESLSYIGPYLKEKILGKGGMAVVWKVRDLKLNRTLALKIMHQELDAHHEIIADFEEEAQISAQLQHPGIIPIYSFEQLENNSFYMTMKEVHGKNLYTLIKELYTCGTITESGSNFRRLIDIFHSVCKTMAYAHSKGVIHRDLKPSNIMIGDYGEVLVVDWGIAKVIDADSTQEQIKTQRSGGGMYDSPGVVLGTPAYMSPEQAWGRIKRVDRRSDIYSLGAILYKIITGETYHKGSIAEILEQKKTGQNLVEQPETGEAKTLLNQTEGSVVFPRDFTHPRGGTSFVLPRVFQGRLLPKELVRICEKAMQPKRENRHESAMELAQEIQAWLDGAQRKEKAMEILKQAHTLEEFNRVLEEKIGILWSKAEEVLSTEGGTSQEGWQLWNEIHNLREQIEENRQELHHLLQGALVYDPELIETHQRLAAFAYQDFLDALLKMDTHKKNHAIRRLRLYIDNLPDEKATYWQERQKKDLRSVGLLRKKIGFKKVPAKR